MNDASASLRTQPEGLVARISALQGQIKDLEREREQMQSKLAASAGQDLLAQAVPLNDSSRLLVATLQGVEAKALREMADQLKNKLASYL